MQLNALRKTRAIRPFSALRVIAMIQERVATVKKGVTDGGGFGKAKTEPSVA